MYLKSLLFILSVQLIANFSYAQQNKPVFREDYVYLEAAGSFYKIHQEEKDWFGSKKTCDDEGAKLFIPENETEVKNFRSYFNETIKDKHYFIGFSDFFVEGVYETIDGRPLSQVYNKWHETQPDNYNNDEDCGMLRADGFLNDYGCTRSSPFICKKRIKNEVTGTNRQQDHLFFRNDYTYLETADSFYKTHTVETTWFEAKKICASEGAELFIPEEQSEVDAVLLQFRESLQESHSVFVGITDLAAEGVFETIDGRSIVDVFHKWHASEPNNQNYDEDCLVLLDDGKLNDRRCKKTTMFICKKTAASLEWNQLCNMPFLDYTFNESIGKCYKYHSKPANWTDAHALCAAEQSYLAVINSQEEANYLVQLTEQHQKSKSGDCVKRSVILGYHNQFDEGWTVVRGTTVEDSGYSTWAPGHPDSEDCRKCGSMLYNGQLKPIGCDKKSVFICEHDILPPF